ncbi:MAG: cytochrome c1 [Kordiimonadaceae bacterium]|nr:cytochrome c1 [Kordiimonadaceae bacterium]MBT6330170.1 cytochrome c1 [Kordiimonadaceae bacterium]
MKNINIKGLLATIVTAALLSSGANAATEGAMHPEKHDYTSTGIFGKFDIPSLQRGLQVYTEVCAACHSMDLVAFRTLEDLGYNEDEIKAIAIEYEYEDTFDDDGELISRPGTPADYFPAPFANEKAARSANGGSLPPDFSTLIKAREHLSFFPWATVYGEDYVVALMTGYHDEAPEGFELTEGLYYNDYFTDYAIAMAPPLFDDFVEYADGTPATVEQMSYDVANFMAWASDPTMQERKEMGLRVILFMIVLSILLYFTNKRVWRKIKKGQDIDPSQL